MIKSSLHQITFINFHICNSLPLVHGYKPGIVLLAATEIDDEFLSIASQSSKNRFESLLRKLPGWKEERSDYNLCIGRRSAIGDRTALNSRRTFLAPHWIHWFAF
jgi:hypothetical protein